MKWLWILFLVMIFFLNLSLNKLLTIEPSGRFNFDLERINITNPAYQKTVARYRFDDVEMTYRVRNIFYSNWQLGILWVDSTLKILSPLFWLRLLGYSGLTLFGLGVYQIISHFEAKYWYSISWILTVIASSGLGIMIDSKMSVILAFPVILQFLWLGFRSKNFSRIKWYWIGLVIIDLCLR